MPDPSAAELLFLAAAALAAGAVNAIGGGGSLLSFPALLAVGYPAVTANVTNTVALLPGYVSSGYAYRERLRHNIALVRRLAVVTVIGSAGGTALLLLAPEAAFEAVVPFLVLLACALLAFQRPLARAVVRRGGGHRGLALSVFGASVYGGYFGAGLGIILLAAMGAFLPDDLQRLNAVKVALSFLVNIVAVVSFAIFGPVAWVAVLVMASANLIGGWLGAGIAQRLRSDVLLWTIVVYGTVVAVVLMVEWL